MSVALVALAGSVAFLIIPYAFSLGPNIAAFVPFALLALVLAPIQATAEEVFFRGYHLQEGRCCAPVLLHAPTASCIDTDLPTGRRNFGQSCKSLIEIAHVLMRCGSRH